MLPGLLAFYTRPGAHAMNRAGEMVSFPCEQEDLLALRPGETARPLLPAGGRSSGRRGVCKECFKAAQRVLWAKNPKIQARRREIVERWRNEGLGV
jgi:hypothetical protein